MTVKQFIAKYEGKTIGFPDGSYVGECLSLVKQYILETTDIYPPASGCNGARCYWSLFPSPLDKVYYKIPNTPDFTPLEGDIIIWNGNTGGGYGHIAICTGNNEGLKYFESFDQNYNGRHAHLVRHTYANVYGVLRPISSIEESMPDKTYTEEEMTAMRLERDKNWSLYQKEKQTSEEYRSEAQSRREDYDRLIEDLAKRLNLPVSSDRSDILAAVDRLLKVEEDLRIEQTNHKKTFETLNREKDELKAEIDQLRAEIERQQKQNETLLNRIDKLESRIEQHEQIRETTNRFSEWLESVLNIFRR